MRGNGERVYYVASSTQGERMLPYAASLAYQFDSKQKAKREISRLENLYAGLIHFAVFQFLN